MQHTDSEWRDILAHTIKAGASWAVLDTMHQEHSPSKQRYLFEVWLLTNGMVSIWAQAGATLFTSSAHLDLDPWEIQQLAEDLDACYQLVDAFELVDDLKCDRGIWLGH